MSISYGRLDKRFPLLIFACLSPRSIDSFVFGIARSSAISSSDSSSSELTNVAFGLPFTVITTRDIVFSTRATRSGRFARTSDIEMRLSIL